MSISSAILPSTSDESTRSDDLMQLFQPLGSPPVIAVDMDDVLCETNPSIAQWHNSIYGTNMDISMFYYYYYWKNPYWGTPSETMAKVAAYYASNHLYIARPIPGAMDGIRALRKMGFSLIVVTARGKNTEGQSWQWLDRHFPGMFETIVCTGQFDDSKEDHGAVTKLHKAQVCRDINAQLLIDDALENAFSVASAPTPTPVLIFGKYEWNTRLSKPSDNHEQMSFHVRFEAEGRREFWRSEKTDLPQHLPLWRVENWEKVVTWVKTQGRERGLLVDPLELS